jgi:tRNA(Ile)-lysidine synthase
VSAADDAPVTEAEAHSLFGALSESPVLALAVSGGPDSTALLWLAARWRKGLKRGPKLIAVTIDHGLRPESKAEASAVKRLARRLGVEHRTLRWSGRKPKTGLQAAARQARYRLLAQAARRAKAGHILTAHTLDDQAETVLFRLARGSGIAGLAGMDTVAPLPVAEGRGILLVRPFLHVPKARLIATLKAAKVAYADDPSNRDPRFARPRLRALMPALAREGLTAERLALAARRAQRIDAALREMASAAWGRVHAGAGPQPDGGPVTFAAKSFFGLPDEIALRLLGQAVAIKGDEGPVGLGKLEALLAALEAGRALANGGRPKRLRRTLAGALVTLEGERLTVDRAPPRRSRALKRP